jgi:osmotically-inducible protein OsmY
MALRRKTARLPRLAVANDAHLIQLVRGALGRNPNVRGLARPNVSSCKLIVSLHGSVAGEGESRLFEEAVRRVPGVRGVENKLVVAGMGSKTA